MTRAPSLRYLCHECGNVLARMQHSPRFFCVRCQKYRRKPTHPALISRPLKRSSASV